MGEELKTRTPIPSTRKLITIQKRNKLNDVYAMGGEGPGGACHDYRIVPSTSDPVPCESKDSIIHACISFQCGPRSEVGSRHGVLDTDLLEIVRDRLKAFQGGEYATRENAIALTHIEEALLWMNHRVEERAARGVLGTTAK